MRRQIQLISILGVGVGACATLLMVSAVAQTSEDGTVGTLIMGLQTREQNLQTLQGNATVAAFYDPQTAAALQRAGEGPLPDGLKFSDTGLHRIAFWLDFTGKRWRIEVAELVSTGYNEWGFLTNYGLTERGRSDPVLVECCDGLTISDWDISFGRAKIRDFDPALRDGGGYVRAELGRSLSLGWGSARAAAYSLGERSEVGGIDCYTLVQQDQDDQYLGREELSVAPELGFAPVRVVGLSVYANEPTRGSRTEQVATSFIRLADDIWFPHEVRMNSYSYVPGKDEAMCSSRVFRFEDLQVNAAIPEFRFHTQLPLGTIVHEMDRTTLTGHTQAALQQFLSDPPAPQYDESYRRPLGGDEIEAAD